LRESPRQELCERGLEQLIAIKAQEARMESNARIRKGGERNCNKRATGIHGPLVRLGQKLQAFWGGGPGKLERIENRRGTGGDENSRANRQNTTLTPEKKRKEKGFKNVSTTRGTRKTGGP